LLDLQSNNDPGIRFGRPTYGSLIRHISDTVDYIAFNCNGASLPSVAATAQVVIDENGNVGIGITNPLVKFVVNGGTVNTATYTSSQARIADGSLHLMKTAAGGIFESIRAMNADTTAGTTVRFLAASTSDPFNNANGGKVFIDAIRTATNMDLAFSLNDVAGAAPVERVRFMGNGNIGIGVTNPIEKLTVAGNIQLSGSNNLNFNTNNLGNGNISFDGSTFTIVSNSNAAPLILSTSSFERMRIASDGKVGIGTASPATLLSVGGAGSTSAASGLTFGGDAQVNLYRIAEDILRTDANLNVIGYVNAGGYIYTSAYIQVAQGNIYPGGYTSDLNLNIGNIAANNWETAIKIKPGSYVGIGTTNPTGKLHVVSSVAGETVFRTDGTNGTLFSVVDDLSDSLMSVNNSAGLPVLEVFADDRVVAGQYGSGDFVLINNKIGVGTSNPANKLSVIGAASIGSNSYNVSAPANGLIVEGSVGIGTTSPDTILTLEKDIAITAEFGSHGHFSVRGKTNTSKRLDLGFNTSTDVGFIQAMINGTSYNNLLLNANGGNVGIGTTSPVHKLQLGALTSTSTATPEILSLGGTFSNTDGSNPKLRIWTDGTYSIGLGVSSNQLDYILGRNIYDHVFYAEGSRLMTIKGGGNVGIGTTAPVSTLDVDNSVVNIPILNLGGGEAGNAVSDLYVLNSYNNNTGVGYAAKVIGVNISGSLTATNIPVQRTIWGGVTSATAIALGTDGPRAGTQDNAFQIWTTNDGVAGTPLTQKFSVSSAGDVGIGIVTPTDKIQISGGGISFTTSTGLAVPMLGITATNLAYIGPYGTPSDGNAPTVVAFNLGPSVQQTWFYASGNIAMVLNKQGRLHIGNNINTPNSLLSVGPSSSTTAVSGMCFGNDASANLYRSATSTIKTDGNLVVAGTTSLNGHIYGNKTVALTTASYTTVLTVNLTAHTSCYVKIGAFGDWGNHSAVAFVSELFIQNGDNAGYGEPGTIITVHDNTAGAAGDKIDIQIVDPAAAGTQNFLIQLKLISATSSTNSSLITYHVMGQQASVT
jgi:hypothetical protein